MKKKNTTLSEQLQNSIEKKTVERSKIETPNLLGTGTSIKSGGVKPPKIHLINSKAYVLCAQCCSSFWIVYSWLLLRFSQTFIV